MPSRPGRPAEAAAAGEPAYHAIAQLVGCSNCLHKANTIPHYLNILLGYVALSLLPFPG